MIAFSAPTSTRYHSMPSIRIYNTGTTTGTATFDEMQCATQMWTYTHTTMDPWYAAQSKLQKLMASLSEAKHRYEWVRRSRLLARPEPSLTARWPRREQFLNPLTPRLSLSLCHRQRCPTRVAWFQRPRRRRSFRELLNLVL